MPPRFSDYIAATRTGSPWRLGFASLLFVLLAATACGASSTVATHATHTPTAAPITPGHGILYMFANNQGGAGLTDVYALGLSDGRQVWHAQASPGGAGGAAIGGGTLYVGTFQGAKPTTLPTGTLQALNASTGAPLWQLVPPFGWVSPLAASSDAVFAVAITATSALTLPTTALMALSAQDGRRLWSVNFGPSSGLEGLGGALFSDGVLYLVIETPPLSVNGSPAAVLDAVDATSGKMLWSTPLRLPPVGNAAEALSGGVLYLAEQDYSTSTIDIQAVRASDGHVLWSNTTTTAGAVGALVVTDGTVCYSYDLANGPGGGIVALHAADGSLNWQTSFQDGGLVPLAADSSAIYARESTQSAGPTLVTTLNTFAANTGHVLFSQPFPDLPTIQVDYGLGTPLQVANGVLYIVESGVALPISTATTQPPAVSIALAFSTHDGSLTWQRQFTGSAQPTFLIAPQT